jgi:hypothetical protein
MYVASISSRCYKSKSDVTHVAAGHICHNSLLQLLGIGTHVGSCVQARWLAAKPMENKFHFYFLESHAH